MAIYQLADHNPQVPESAWVADTASVIGQVELGEKVSVWYGAVVRADSASIRIGRDSNIQDNSVLHVDDGVPLIIGDGVTVGHQVMLHGCTIGDGSLIGIGAIVLNRARIGRNCIVGAGSLVTEGKEFPDGSLIIGSPARAVRSLTEAQMAGNARSAAHYVDNAQRHRRGLSENRVKGSGDMAGDELHKFLFDGMPVRGMLVRLERGWQELLRRREPEHGGSGSFAMPVRALLGEMAAAAVLMQSNIKFNGALILQVHGDGPVKLAVAEAQPDLSFRATASVLETVPDDAQLQAMLNVHGRGRCAITLDPQDRLPGQQPYQGIVPLHGDRQEPLECLSRVLEHYMLQSEQLDTRLVLAADDRVAAGLLIQRLPLEGAGNLEGTRREDLIGLDEDFNRIAHLGASLTREELLTLDVATVLRRLFWQEPLQVQPPLRPGFACRCSADRVRAMLRGLGRDELDGILLERADVEIGCEYCGLRYRFDAVDVGGLFTPTADQPPGSSAVN